MMMMVIVRSFTTVLTWISFLGNMHIRVCFMLMNVIVAVMLL